MWTVFFGVIGFSVGLALMLNMFSKSNRNSNYPEMLTPENEANKCNLHVWEKARFLSPELYEDCQKNPDKYAESLFCIECGWVPGMKAMVTPHYLDAVKSQLKKVAEAQKQMEVVNEMKARWLSLYLQGNPSLTAGEILLVKKGFDLYDEFVDVLPDLLEAREANRAKESLKTPV